MLLIIFTLIAHSLGSSECSQELTLKSTLSEQSLDLNCTLHNAHADNISLVMSVVISKSSANQDEVLASAASVGGASPVTHHLEDAIVTSDLTWDGNSDSFMSIYWSRASQDLNGNYTCTLNGLNQDYIPVTLVSMVTVYLDDNDPALIATPLVIEIGLTESLSLNCSLPDPRLFNLTTVSFIQLSYVHGGIDQILASVSPVGPETKPGSGASHVTGFLGDQTQGSYLEATWQFPDVDNTGEYVCQVVGINSSGLPVLFRTAVNVMAMDPPREQLINKIAMLQSQNTKLHEDNQVLEDHYLTALQNLTFFEELCENLTFSANESIKDASATDTSTTDTSANNCSTTYLYSFIHSPSPVESSQCSQELTFTSTSTGQVLDLNCTLHNAHVANISNIISIVISRSTANQDQVLASAASLGGASPVTHHLEDAVVTSDVSWDVNSDSFLSVQWSRASQALDGNYTCTLSGLNQDYIPVTLVIMVTVSLDDTDPALIATPLVIEIGLTQSLSLNCSLSDPNLLHVTTVTLIELFYVHGGIDQILASVSPAGPESKPGSGASHVTGFLGDQSQGSYLEATWQFPDVDNTGEYVCQVVGINSSGLPVLFQTAVNVTAKDPSREDLVNKIVMLQSENTLLEERLKLTTQQLHDFNTSSMEHISAVEDQYQSALHSLTFLEQLCQNVTASANESIEDTPINNCSSSYNFTCDFDTDMCGFTNDTTAQRTWIRNSGTTVSSNTGPTGDHTSGAGYYMYLETSNGYRGDAARLNHDFPAFPTDTCTMEQQGCLTFWYHMYGSTIGTLNVSMRKGGKDNLSFNRTGAQGNEWLQGNITLTTVDQPFSVTFEAIRGRDYTGDIAIDDISILAGKAC